VSRFSLRLTSPVKPGAVAGRYLHVFSLLAIVLALVVEGVPVPSSKAQTSWGWYKTDTHVHSSVSGDGEVDIGIISKATNEGYNALFLTDHDAASGYQMNAGTANHLTFDDAYAYPWSSGTYGTATSITNELVATPVSTGTKSLHLASASSGYAESYEWAVRGPNLRSGSIILKVSIYPTRIDPGSGLYVSVSLGSDPTVYKTPLGYTTQAGVVSPGKSTVLLWQLGSTRATSADPNRRVLTYPLGSYVLNTWNTYTVNVSAALADIPPADQALDYNGLTNIKMTAASNGGTVDAYFDTFTLDASAPAAPGDEFVYRNSVAGNYNTNTFTIFPSDEMGQNKHSQRFNFGITQSSQYVGYANGTDGIPAAQQSGYPAMTNHPGTSITTQEVIDTRGEGADFIETKKQAYTDTWDAILRQGAQIIASWSSDSHNGMDYAGTPATYIYAPTMGFDDLLHSLFEGRAYNANNTFGGRVIFNLDSASQEPYPARFPMYVPSTQTTATVHLLITAGLDAGYTINWISNSGTISTDSATGSSYEATKTIPLSGTSTYVRAEVRSPSGVLQAQTQAIFFIPVAGLPSDKSYHVDRITTASGTGYTKISTSGITSSSWDATAQALSLTLQDPANTLVRLLMPTAASPQAVTVDGMGVPGASSLAQFQAATGSSWYYDSTVGLLYLQALHANSVASVGVAYAAPGPGTPTSTPVASTPTATATSTPTSTPTVTGGLSAYQAAVLADAPVSYWRLGELSGTTAADSRDGNSGTITGGVTLGGAGALPADTNKAMAFNGIDGYVSVASSANLNITGDLSLELWAKPGVLGVTMEVAQKGGTGGSATWQYRLRLSASKHWQGNVFSGSTTYTVTDPGTPSTSRWDHLVLTRSGSTLTLYVNGVSVDTTTASGALNTSSGILAIGRRGADATDYFQGAIDEVAVYNTGLSPARVLAHYTAANTAARLRSRPR